MMRINRHPIIDQKGFTLSELLVVCALVGLVMAGLLGLIMSGQQAYWFGTTQVDAQQNVRVALERMVKEVREAGYAPQGADTTPVNCPSALYPLYPTGPACFTFVPVTGQSATALTVQFDWNGNNSIQMVGMVTDPLSCATPATLCRGERVTYSFAGGNLTRQEVGVDGAPVVIASGITGLTFTYRDLNNNVTALLDQIRTVEISMTAQTANQGAYVTMVDRVRFRNR